MPANQYCQYTNFISYYLLYINNQINTKIFEPRLYNLNENKHTSFIHTNLV